MSDAIDDELRLMADEGASHEISSEMFRQPVRRLFSKNALAVDVAQTVGEAVALMRETGFGAVAVTRDGKIAGILTERDMVVRVIGVVEDFEKTPVERVMTPDPVTLRSDDPIVYVMHNMQVGGYRHVPVVDDDHRPVSIVSIKDVVRFVLGYFPRDVYNLTPEPYRGPKR